MYYEYWSLHKPAFDNVPDPSMYVDCHASMENAIAETLFAIEEGDECIAVIVGDVGLGKTMSLRMIIDSLDPGKYRMALITNPGVSFGQILQEIIGQLTGAQCHEKRKVQLLETFNRLLFTTVAEGRKILIFIDEANAITPANLENLRLLTNMQGDRRNLFTMILAGQIEFARRLEHPKRANLFQRVGTYCRIDRLESAETVRQYVETRLRLAGATGPIFAADAFAPLWEQADYGVPRLVNKICKLCLKAGETNGFTAVSGEMVEQIGSRFHKLAGPVVEQRRPRTQDRKAAPARDGRAFPRQAEGMGLAGESEDAEEPSPTLTEAADPMPAGATDTQLIETISAPPQEETPPADRESQAPLTALPEGKAADGAVTEAPEPSPADLLGFTPRTAAPAEPAETDSEAELDIGSVRIRIRIPRHLLKQSQSANAEYRFRLAGGLAAETLRRHPQLMASPSADPVPIWLQIRDFVLERMTEREDREKPGRATTIL